MMTKIEMQAMDAVVGIHREMKKANEPDWKQQQYGIAKEVFLHRMKTSLNSVKDDVEGTTEWADLFISEPKRER